MSLSLRLGSEFVRRDWHEIVRLRPWFTSLTRSCALGPNPSTFTPLFYLRVFRNTVLACFLKYPYEAWLTGLYSCNMVTRPTCMNGTVIYWIFVTQFSKHSTLYRFGQCACL